MEVLATNISQNVSDPTSHDKPAGMERKFYLDLLKVIAISAVVMIHACAEYVDHPSNFMDFTIGNICDSISRLGVPLFLMISGALILDENRKYNCKKRIRSVLLPWLTWSFLYALSFQVIWPLLKDEAVSLSGFVAGLVKGHFHLWYMWAITGMYLITPILRTFVKKENKHIVAYFILLSLVFQFTRPIIALLFEEISFASELEGAYAYIFESLNVDFFGGLTTYFLAGWYLANIDLKKSTVTVLYILGASSVTCIIAVTQMLPDHYALLYSYEGVFVFLYSVAVFLLVKRLCVNCKSSNRFVIGLSNLSFGVYLIHMFAQMLVEYVLPKHPLWIPVIFLATMSISVVASYVISKIPVVKKIIRA